MNPIKGWLADAGKNPDTRHVDTCDGVRALAILHCRVVPHLAAVVALPESDGFRQGDQL